MGSSWQRLPLVVCITLVVFRVKNKRKEMLIGNRLHGGIGRYISLPQQDFSQSPGSAKRSMLVDCKKLQQIVTFIDLTLDSQRWIACPEVNLADTAVTPWALPRTGPIAWS